MAACRSAGSVAKPLLHGFHRRSRNVRDRAPPSSVHRCDYAVALVHQQNRHAVRSLDRDHRARAVFEKRIALPQDAAPAFGRDHRRGVDLLDRG